MCSRYVFPPRVPAACSRHDNRYCRTHRTRITTQAMSSIPSIRLRIAAATCVQRVGFERRVDFFEEARDDRRSIKQAEEHQDDLRSIIKQAAITCWF